MSPRGTQAYSRRLHCQPYILSHARGTAGERGAGYLADDAISHAHIRPLLLSALGSYLRDSGHNLEGSNGIDRRRERSLACQLSLDVVIVDGIPDKAV